MKGGKRISTRNHFMNLTRKVLVIGAEPATISLYSSHLEPAGFSLASASLGDPIIERVRDSKAEAVLLDLSSPSPSGAEAFRRIRSEPDFGSLPLFVLSNGAGATPSDNSIRDARVKVFQEGSAPPAEVARTIEEILNARKNGSIIANVPQVQPPVNDDIPLDDDLIQDVLPMTRKLCEVVRTFCRTLERERRIDLLAVMRQEARRLRNSFSAANFEVLSAFTSALERLFTALSKDVGTINGSTLKTISYAMDFLVQAASSNSGDEEMERAPIRMLAVDDDPVCLRTLTMLASNTKVLGLVACDGVETALRELKAGDFDLIFSDILMPGMNGFEFVAELRKEPKYRDTPVVFVTALSDFETRSRSVLSGGCDLIAKPFTAGEVLVKALTLGLKRRFDSAAMVAQVESSSQEVRPNRARVESQVPSPNNRGNGQATPPPGSQGLQGLAGRGVIVVEGHGGIRSINMVAAELLGYSPDEATKGDIRTLFPDELQSEVNKTLLSRVIVGGIKNQSGIEMTGRRKDNSTIQLQVAMGETRVQDMRTIICLLQAVSPTVAATEEASELPVGTNPSSSIGMNAASAVVANPVIAESTSRIEKRDATLAERTRAKEYRESCGSERAALLDELKTPLRGQNSTVDDPSRETEVLNAFSKARVVELEQTPTLSDFQAKEHLDRQSELECKCATIQSQVNCLSESLAKAAADLTAAEQQATELAELRRVMEQDLAASRQREENLRAELTAAEATWAKSDQRHGAVEQELCQAHEKVGKLESRLVELENKFLEEVGQREKSGRRLAELEQTRVALEEEIRHMAEREVQLKSECTLLEQQGQVLTESLSRTQALLEKAVADRATAEGQVCKLVELQRHLEQELAASQQQQQHLGVELNAAQALVDELEKTRAALGQDLSQAQGSVGELAARLVELENKFCEEAGRRERSERRAAELEKARARMEGEIREWAGREDRLKSECARLEQQGQRLTENLSDNQALLAQEAAGRKAAEGQAAELAELQKSMEQNLAMTPGQKGNWEAELATAQATVAELEHKKAALEAEIRERAEREGQHKLECAQLEHQGQRLTESLTKTRTLLVEEVSSRKAAEQEAAELTELRKALEQELTANLWQIEDLRTALAMAKATVVELGKNQAALDQELGKAQDMVSELVSRVGALDSKLHEEVGQRENWQKRAAESEQARVGLQGEIREWAERERQFKSECVRLEQQAQRLTESLSQTQATLAQEAAVRMTAERQAREQAELRRSSEQDLAASQRQKENLRAALAAAEATVIELDKRQSALDQELGEAQGKVSELAPRVGALKSKLHEEAGQRSNWEQRATELEQSRVALEQDLEASQRQKESLRVEWTTAQAALAGMEQKQAALEGEIREWAEREGRLKSECSRMELQGRGLAESLSQTQVLLAQEAAGRKAAEQQAEELAELRRALEQDLAADRSQKENLGAELTAAQAAVVELEQKHTVLEGEIREWAEREGRLKSECARLEQQGQGLTESLSQAQALLAQEAAGRTATEQQAGELSELRRTLERELAASQRQNENLGAELTAAQAAVAESGQKREALEDWIREWAEREGRLKSKCVQLEQQGRGLAEMEKKLSEEVGQRENWQRRAAELEQARVALEGEIRGGAEREGQLKSDCAKLEQKGQALTKSLNEIQALLAKETDGRTLAEQQAGELVKRLRALEQNLATSQKWKENPRANPKADQGSVKRQLPHSRVERRPLNLLQRLGQFARRSMMLSRKPFKLISKGDNGELPRTQEPEQPNAGVVAPDRPIRAGAGIARRRDQAARRTPSRTVERVRRFRAAVGGNRSVTGANRGPTGRGRSKRGNRKGERK